MDDVYNFVPTRTIYSWGAGVRMETRSVPFSCDWDGWKDVGMIPNLEVITHLFCFVLLLLLFFVIFLYTFNTVEPNCQFFIVLDSKKNTHGKSQISLSRRCSLKSARAFLFILVVVFHYIVYSNSLFVIREDEP